MKLWVTLEGDRWLCDECQSEFAAQIDKEKWRAAFERWDPTLRCDHCGHGDIEVLD